MSDLRYPSLYQINTRVRLSELSQALGRAARARDGGRDEGPVVLDTVEQFRFYSGWRAAVERRR